MGSLTTDGTISYSYNAAGRRLSATAANLNASYTYNALGQRITKTVSGTTTQYVYDEQGHLAGEYDSAGQLIQETLWLGDLPVAVLKPSASAATPDIYYIHADYLGTPRKITRPGDNRVVWSWEFEAFGASLPDPNPLGLGNFVFNLRFPGQYYDQETGLFYNGFRDYDPATGRYSESDPIGLAGGMNTYTYVFNNPLRWTDPLGLEVQICCRPAQIANGLIDHCWVKTDTKEAGMGANPNIPPGAQYEGYGMPVQITDHSNDTATQCTTQQNVNESCVNQKLEIGKPIGRFIPPVNQCQAFAHGVVNSCRTGPQEQ